ncbi:MAG: hypothetical protein AAGD88_15925 [Bacteroidota bacterium]
MPKPNLLQTLADFQAQSYFSSLKITFGVHDIINYRDGHLLNQAEKRKSRIIVVKTSKHHIAQIKVMDNLLFRFSFHISLPKILAGQTENMIQLPRPLEDGHLRIQDEKLELSFRIDAPESEPQLTVEHCYAEVRSVKASFR